MDVVIRTEGLCKHYGPTPAVDGLDLEVPRGSVFGLLGPNGAGKTTTFGMLCGWLAPTRGRAEILGLRPRDLHRLRGRVAVLPQDAELPAQVSVTLTLAHYGRLMGLGQDAHRHVASALERVGLADAARLRGDQLSHGMLKRVALAQAILGEPEVVLLDEPTSGLDPKSARAIKDLIAGLAPKTTVVLSSHNLAEVQELCTDGAILDRGKLVLAGSMDAITRRGAEVQFHSRAESAWPVEALAQAFGRDAVIAEPAHLRLRFSSQADPAEIIGRALRMLLDAGVPILGVERGTSLERAFLEVTGQPTQMASTEPAAPGPSLKS